ncbi:KNR4/SMI1 2 [Hypsizygus marmoreus]|uniref:KNR4/SMI1 2 n=1 Tax=Hypsizygus marmoreus TaxID=39966 RepID=A0A369JSH8_HYPMA|nr:KNR4/SMI1 2 [Hypsizygus marmoreus]
MGWLSSLFSSENSQYNRKGQALSSTHEAFSLPTSSPTATPHPDAFNPDQLNTPDLDGAMSPSYTYPPPSPGAYGYVPTSAGLNSRPVSASLLPTHMDSNHTPISSKFGYPPLSSTWNRLRTWLSREYPELGDTLNYGILPQDLAQIEMQFGFALPHAVRESYLCVDGQEAESAAGCSEGLFFGLKLLPLEDVHEEWRFWREVDDDSGTGANPQLREVMQSIPPGWVRKEYSQRGWIPLIADKVGNYVGVDMNPGERGAVGQVIVFGRDFDTKVVLWRGDGPTGWAKWLASFVDDLESGEGIEIGVGSDGSDGSEDDLGYESYFYDGSGRGQGDGGGDTGSGGGLRLNGEYRGWNVLEAWADRSLRRWHEAGVITDTSLLPPEEENNVQEPAVLDIPHDSNNVGIPVLADVDDPTPTGTTTTDKPALPTISVTKAPAPRPVELPQPHDILPDSDSPESPHSSFNEDLESGRSHGMREVTRENTANFVSASRRSATTNPSQPPTSNEALAAASTRLRSVSPSARTQPTPASTVDIPDLLADFAPAMDTQPIAPSSPASLSTDLVAPVATPEARVEPTSPFVIDDTLPPPPQMAPAAEALDTATTIRLVGGGGVAGVAGEPSEEGSEETKVEPEKDEADGASIVSEEKDKNGNGKKGHKKTKSGLSGLKKLGGIVRGSGSGSRRDSSGSVKSGVAAPAPA